MSNDDALTPSLPDLLAEWEQLLEMAGPPSSPPPMPGVRWPYPGWDQDERPPTPPTEAKQLWAWRNGAGPGPTATSSREDPLSIDRTLLTVDLAADYYRAERDSARQAFDDPDEYYPAAFLPIAKVGNGDLLVIDTDHPTGQLIVFQIQGFGLDEQRVVAPSITDMVQANVDLLRAGARTWDIDHGWTTDLTKAPLQWQNQAAVDLNMV